jgi:dTDP-4-amino-4,6-dideoxygalactose transaminase
MIFTSDESMVQKLRSIRVHGQGSDKYNNVRIGINGRLDTLMAAILLPKVEIFDEEIELRQKVAGRYTALLDGLVKTPVVEEHNISAWAQYTIRHPEREKIMAGLKEEGIPTAIYYPKPLHLQEAFTGLGYSMGDLPVSEKVAKEVFSIPMHPYMMEEEQQTVANAIKNLLK